MHAAICAGIALALSFVAAPAAALVPVGIPGNWTLVFQDEFTGGTWGTPLTWNKWNLNWFGDQTGPRRITGTVHSAEIAAYNPSNCLLSGDGRLIMHLKQETVTAWEGGSNFATFNNTTCHLNTMGRFEVRYGVFEVQMFQPGPSATAVPWNWAAIWLNGYHDDFGGWPRAGEIDVMENLSNGPDVHIHYGSPDINWSPSITAPSGGWSNSWHTYAVNWTPTKMEFYYDGVKVGEKSIQDDHQKYIGIQYGTSNEHGGDVSIPRLGQAGWARYYCPAGVNCVVVGP